MLVIWRQSWLTEHVHIGQTRMGPACKGIQDQFGVVLCGWSLWYAKLTVSHCALHFSWVSKWRCSGQPPWRSWGQAPCWRQWWNCHPILSPYPRVSFQCWLLLGPPAPLPVVRAGTGGCSAGIQLELGKEDTGMSPALVGVFQYRNASWRVWGRI